MAPYLGAVARIRSLLLPLVLLAIAGCWGDPARENPLDPLSDAFRDAGTVEGRVTGIYPPFEGREGVRVVLAPIGAEGPELAAWTGPDGAFRIPAVPSGRYAVIAAGEPYRTQTDTVTVAASQTAEALLPLDALPVVTAQAARTVHIERWFPEAPVYRFEIEAEATDPDRPDDLASAALVIGPDVAGAERVPLAETAPGRFAASLGADDLPTGSVQALLGQTLRVEATDQQGNSALGPPLALVRVIEQTPLTLAPQGFTFIADNPPTLTWRAASLPFAFTYRADLFLVDAAGIPNLLWSETGLPPTQLALPVPEALAPGDYYWTLWVVDAAGNRSRSKEAGFRVP